MVLFLTIRDSSLVIEIATLIMFIGSAMVLLMALLIWDTIGLGMTCVRVLSVDLLDRFFCFLGLLIV